MPRVRVAADRPFTTINRAADSFTAKSMPVRPICHPVAGVADRSVQVHWTTIFIELAPFARARGAYGMDDAEFAQLQAALLADSDAGDVIPASTGCRKLRWRAGEVASAVATV